MVDQRAAIILPIDGRGNGDDNRQNHDDDAPAGRLVQTHFIAFGQFHGVVQERHDAPSGSRQQDG